MIEIKAEKTSDDVIEMSMELKGSGLDLVLEAFSIISELPKKLYDNDPNMLKALTAMLSREKKIMTEVLDGNHEN
jgi:hypothetical protein